MILPLAGDNFVAVEMSAAFATLMIDKVSESVILAAG